MAEKNLPATPPAVAATPSVRSPVGVAVKRVVQASFFVPALPYLVGYRLGAFVWGRNRAFLQTSEWISLVPGIVGVYLRQAFYRWTLGRCGADVYFGWLSTFAMTEAEVGDRAYIGRRCGIGFATIGADAMLADGVQILSGGREHGVSADGAHRDAAAEYRRVTVGVGAWIGTNAVVMADVGDGAVVGAGAVATKPIPPRVVAVGVPAKAIRELS